MTAPPSQLRLMLVDDDPVFRLGLRIWLEQTAGYRVVAEAGQAGEALTILQSRGELPDQEVWSEADESAVDRQPAAGVTAIDIDLVILDLGLGAGNPDQIPGLQLCRDIKTRYPALPVLVLSIEAAPVLAAAARQMGADEFALRGLPVRELGQIIERLSRINRPSGAVADAASPLRSAVTWDDLSPSAFAAPPGLVPGLFAAQRWRMRRSALTQIEAAMADIEAERRRGRGDVFTEAVLAGRYRELRAARWLMGRLLATPALAEVEPGAESPVENDRSGSPAFLSGVPRSSQAQGQSAGSSGSRSLPTYSPALTQADRLALQQGDLATLIFEGVFRKLQGNLANTSDVPLEIDILRDDKKRELLFLTLRKIEDALDSLRRATLPPGQLAEKAPTVLQDIWTEVITDFLGRYYTLQIDNLEQPVVPTLMEEREVVRESILNKIPQVPMLLGHLLFQESLLVDGNAYVASTPEAMDRSQILLENMLIQLANGVMQPLLNQFGDVELLKKNLYQRRMMTSRDIARFRNELSWRYRWDQLVNEPKAIFESQYRLFGFTERGIQPRFVYAPRREELEQLSGLQRTVTLAVEARDAIAPRFRSLVGLVGSGVVYVLTDVLGRGIGLIGRGILRGVGNAWNDPRYRGKE
jgi:DNA-binding NarL/FixJ family response regulator